MKKGSFKLKHNIRFRKFLLNLSLLIISPTNKVALMLSQNLDKHITLKQKELFEEYSLR